MCAFALEDVCQPVLLSGRLLRCFMARRASPLSNEALEEATAESLRPGGGGPAAGTRQLHTVTECWLKCNVECQNDFFFFVLVFKRGSFQFQFFFFFSLL